MHILISPFSLRSVLTLLVLSGFFFNVFCCFFFYQLFYVFYLMNIVCRLCDICSLRILLHTNNN